VRVWIDITAPAHVLVFQPLIALLRQRGDEVEVTSRHYAQTAGLLDLHGIEAELIGVHGGGGRVGKLQAMAARLPALVRFARGRGFDMALAHGSHELTLAARRLGIPSATTFDYEFAALQHQLGCRAATRVVVPEAIPASRLTRYGLRPPKLRRYPGLKEEYYLSDFEPDPAVLTTLGVDRSRILVVVRTPADIALYHAGLANTLLPRVLERLGRDEHVHAVVIPRTEEQRDSIRRLALPSLLLPDGAVDAQSLIALADLVVSAGGTMNREAAALGVPVYTTFAGRLGGVDEWLIREGRLRQLRDAAELELVKRGPASARTRRDPGLMLDLLTSGNSLAIG
jgi:predicted glycosyltransferase